MTPIKTFATALCGLALMGCGPLNEGNIGKGALQAVSGLLPGKAAPAAAPAGPVVTRAQLDAQPGTVMIVTAHGGASVASMVPAAVNLNRVTWVSADNVSVTTENGMIIATRGFPRDLMAANVIESRRALAAGGGTSRRTHETLSGMDQISTELLQCSIAPEGAETINIVEKAYATRRFTESCKGENIAFTNTYWLDAGGQIVRSLQAVSPETGILQLDRP